MSKFRRQLMMASMGEPIPPLPYDAEVEWLQSDGVAFINTNIAGTYNTRVEMGFTILSGIPSNFAIYGSRTSAGHDSNMLFFDKTYNRWSWRYNTQSKDGGSAKAGDFVASNVNTARSMVISGDSSVTLTANSSTFTTNWDMYIFCFNNAGSPSGISSGSVYLQVKYFKMYEGTTLVRDYIPVRKNGVGYLYDKVSSQLFGNANSTGAFTYGNDVNI